MKFGYTFLDIVIIKTTFQKNSYLNFDIQFCKIFHLHSSVIIESVFYTWKSFSLRNGTQYKMISTHGNHFHSGMTDKKLLHSGTPKSDAPRGCFNGRSVLANAF